MQVPNKFLVFAKYGTRPAETPDWAWDLVYSGNDENAATAKYLEVTMADENNTVIITRQAIVKLEAVE